MYTLDLLYFEILYLLTNIKFIAKNGEKELL